MKRSLKNAFALLRSGGVDGSKLGVLRGCTAEGESRAGIAHAHFGLAGQPLHDGGVVVLRGQIFSLGFGVGRVLQPP